jgi:hypothetical protein
MPKVPPEVIIEQYELKATFVSNRLETFGFVGLFERADKLLKTIGKDVDWSERASFGINEEAFCTIRLAGRDPSLYFCHPNILSVNPSLLPYYRCISTFSQKGW